MATAPNTSPATSADTRQAIFDAALRLFADNGYDGTSIRDIVQAAGVTKPALYYYFGSKERLFYTIIKEIGELFLRDLHAILERKDDFYARFRDLIRYYVECSRVKAEMLRLFFSTAFAPRKQAAMMDLRETLLDDRPSEDPHILMLKTFLQEGIDCGAIREAPLDYLVRQVLGAVVIYMQESALEDLVPPQGAEEWICDLLLSGIGGKRE